MSASAFIPQYAPWFDGTEAEELADYMNSGGYLTEFQLTERFEKILCEYTGSPHAVMTNSGTSALVTMLYACGIGPGDEVIVPNYTMIATPNAVRAVGAKPVLVDVDLETLTLDLGKTRDAVSKNTKAVLLVLANGREPSSGIGAFSQLCDELGLLLLEDAAQALGSKYRDGRSMGTAGVAGMISFSPPKIITTGQGGCVLTSRDWLADGAKKAKDFGRERGGVDIHPNFGLNFKFTDMQAAVGLAQMRKISQRVSLKREIFEAYRERLAPIEEVHFFDQDMEVTVPWFVEIAVPNRQELSEHLEDKRIGSRPMYPPINGQPIYGQHGDFPNSTWVGSHGLWLPSSPQLTDLEISKVITELEKFFSR